MDPYRGPMIPIRCREIKAEKAQATSSGLPAVHRTPITLALGKLWDWHVGRVRRGRVVQKHLATPGSARFPHCRVISFQFQKIKVAGRFCESSLSGFPP